jgi:CheY-like chemotaxis protein
VSAPARVLLVDDDEGIREFVSLVLADEGYEVLVAPHGVVALELLETARPAVILLDMRTPVMDGPTFVGAYRGRPGPHAPIVVLTASRDAADDAAEIDADGYLAKPFELDDLLRLVRQYAGGG